MANITVPHTYVRIQLDDDKRENENMIENFNLHFLVIQQHAINLGDCILGSIFVVKMYKAIAFRISVFSVSNLTRENVSESTEGVIQSLVIDTLVQILNENVSDTRFAKRRIALRPHDSTRSSLDWIEIHRI